MSNTVFNRGADATVFNDFAPVSENNSIASTNENQQGGSNAPLGCVNLDAGSVLPGDYHIIRRIGTANAGGEADLYLSEHDGELYAVKIFRRAIHAKEDLPAKLKNTKSPYVARIYETGEFAGKRFEVYDYFKKGSFAERLSKEGPFSYEDLKGFIIPDLNEALHDLHEAGILHRDIKPANVMWSNEGTHPVLIDFGLSSVIRESKSIVVSEVGFTASYAAPEVLRNVYFDESDYYSLGILIYELFTGKTPFGEENAYTNIITKPADMPEDLYQLILGLTYADLSYRHDLSNPNRRWTYEEVRKWIDGVSQPIPGLGGGASEAEEDGSIPPVSFMHKQYTDMNSLMSAIGWNWKEGRDFILRNQLTEHLRLGKNVSKTRLYHASVIEDTLADRNLDSDEKLAAILYTISPDLPYLFSPAGAYESIEDFVNAMFEALSGYTNDILRTGMESLETLIPSGVMMKFAEAKGESDEHKELIREFENRMKDRIDWRNHRESYCYEFAYRYTGREELNVNLPDGTVFRNIEEVKKYLTGKKGEGYIDLYRVTAYFLDDAHTLKPAVYGWMKAKGYSLGEEFGL